MSDLLPCPFCGAAVGEPEFVSADNRHGHDAGGPLYAVVCPGCGVRTRPTWPKERAVEAWQRRTPPAEGEREP